MKRKRRWALALNNVLEWIIWAPNRGGVLSKSRRGDVVTQPPRKANIWNCELASAIFFSKRDFCKEAFSIVLKWFEQGNWAVLCTPFYPVWSSYILPTCILYYEMDQRSKSVQSEDIMELCSKRSAYDLSIHRRNNKFYQ